MELRAPGPPASSRQVEPGRLEAGAPSEEARRIAEEFEAMVLSELFAPVFEHLDTEGLGGGGAGERMFRPLLVRQYAEAMSHAGGVGLADAIVRELTRMQIEVEPREDAGHGADR